MKSVTFIVLIALSELLYGQCCFTFNKKTNLAYVNADSSLYTGICQVDFKNGLPQYYYELINGKLMLFKIWRKDGSLEKENRYTDGYNSNFSEFRYNKDGKLQSSAHYLVTGDSMLFARIIELDGLSLEYQPNGIINYTYYYFNGNFNLFWNEAVHFKTEDNQFSAYNSTNDSLFSSSCKKQYSNGALVYECTFKDGLIMNSKTWDEKGNLIDSINYLNGFKLFTQYQYYKNGNLKSIGTFIIPKFNGLLPEKIILDGLVTAYKENGNKICEVNYKEGKLHGEYKEYLGAYLYEQRNYIEGRIIYPAFMYGSLGTKYSVTYENSNSIINKKVISKVLVEQ